jgi:RHS repeat-associated protein
MRIGGTLYYVLKDHLGSASVLTDASGNPVAGADERYYPFGEKRLNSSMLTDKLFTGQREITGLGVYHFGARFYSPKLGRFVSPDTIVPSPSSPQAFNRYSYVTNNPLRYIDPTGHRACDDFDSYGRCITIPGGGGSGFGGIPKRIKPSDYGLQFNGNGGKGDEDDFTAAVAQEAAQMYDAYCQDQTSCEFSTPAELYVATHGTTVITFSNSSQSYFCERNANVGQEGVICWANSKGKIDPKLAAHEMAHVFNALISNNGETTPYLDLEDERKHNPNFPALDTDIASGHKNDSGSTGEDFANMYSMWVFDDWPNSTGGNERRKFMNNNLSPWIGRMLNP